MEAKPFDKYKYYIDSVQDAPQTAEHVSRFYKQLRGKPARILREDFCGTFAIASEWVRRNKANRAMGVDIDDEPIKWGMTHHAAFLSAQELKRLQILKADVRSPRIPPSDIIVAMNFSFFIFKARRDLLGYFKSCRQTLRKDGLLDPRLFRRDGNVGAQRRENDAREIYLLLGSASFDPITHHSLFHIHYKLRGKPKRKKVFTYDWRMWTLPELRYVLEDAGFKNSYVYWEGEDENGEGNGQFRKVTKAENCEAWIAYLVAAK